MQEHTRERADSPTTGEANMNHGEGGIHQMDSDVTRPQLTVVTVLSVLVLVASLLWSAGYANLSIGAHDVEGAIMPPGMIMTRDTPAEAMVDMAAIDPGDVSYTAPEDARGDQPLAPRLENGVKVFDLDVSVIEWNILPDTHVWPTPSMARCQGRVFALPRAIRSELTSRTTCPSRQRSTGTA